MTPHPEGERQSNEEQAWKEAEWLVKWITEHYLYASEKCGCNIGHDGKKQIFLTIQRVMDAKDQALKKLKDAVRQNSDEARREIADLQAQLAEAHALEKRLLEVYGHDDSYGGKTLCACNYDMTGDICLIHQRYLDKQKQAIESQLSKLRADIEGLEFQVTRAKEERDRAMERERGQTMISLEQEEQIAKLFMVVEAARAIYEENDLHTKPINEEDNIARLKRDEELGEALRQLDTP